MEALETLKKQAYDAAKEILEIGRCKAGDLFVVGCSTSEVLGDKIGTASSPETGSICRNLPGSPGKAGLSGSPVL